MNTPRKIAAYALTALLLGGSAGAAVAQTTGIGANGTATTAPVNRDPVNRDPVNRDPVNRDPANRDDDRGFDWGWLGLIGLVGLAGLRRRDRAPQNLQHRAGMGTTTTAR